MIEYIGKTKPLADEYSLHLRLIQNLMGRYKRIGLFSIPDGGKTRVMRKLMVKFEDTEWTLYDQGEHFLDGSDYQEPFIYSFISPLQIMPENLETIYVLQYSTEYKEAVSGIRFNDGIFRPIGEYFKYSNWHHFGQNDLRGKSVKSVGALRKYIS